MKIISFYLPLIIVVSLIFASIAIDGVSAYDIPDPLGWLSNPSEAQVSAGCSP